MDSSAGVRWGVIQWVDLDQNNKLWDTNVKVFRRFESLSRRDLEQVSWGPRDM